MLGTSPGFFAGLDFIHLGHKLQEYFRVFKVYFLYVVLAKITLFHFSDNKLNTSIS